MSRSIVRTRRAMLLILAAMTPLAVIVPQASAATKAPASTFAAKFGAPQPKSESLDPNKPPEVGDGPVGSLSLYNPNVGPAGSPQSLTVTPQATYPNDTLQCNQWKYVAAQLNSYVIGNCSPGTQFYRRQKTDGPVNGTYWYGGYVNGDFQGCGWVNDQNITSVNSTTHSACDPPNIGQPNVCDYMACYPDGTPAVYGSTGDGQPQPLKTQCYMYANIRPWLPNQSLGAPINGPYNVGDLNPQGTGPRVYIRYGAKYTINGVAFTMARDSFPAAGKPNWGFMPISCF